MLMPGPFELIILLLVGGIIVMALARLFGGGSSRSEGGGFSLGHTTLNCPHCSEETRAGVPTCEHCGRDL